MNKNYKKKYAASQDYMKLTDIADVMTKNGDKMNHSTVRNHLLSGLTKIAKALLIANGMSEAEAEKLAPETAKSPHFQEYICDYLHSIKW